LKKATPTKPESMKKINVFFICFLCTFSIAWLYLDIIELQSVYWLAGKLMGFLLIFIGLVFKWINNNEGTKLSSAFSICFWAILVGFLYYRDITEYKRNACQDKFGREFNDRRRSIGIPEIPADWHVFLRSDWSFHWQGKRGAIGHESKSIYIDSSAIDSESDRYHLKPIDSISRDMSITTIYAKGKGMDSIFYHYKAGNDNRRITRKQADSIFAAEKIKKDY
jgi:hypothetical protein